MIIVPQIRLNHMPDLHGAIKGIFQLCQALLSQAEIISNLRQMFGIIYPLFTRPMAS